MSVLTKFPGILARSLNRTQIIPRFLTSGAGKVIIEKDAASGIATIYFNNPPVNLFDGEMFQRSTEAIESVAADNEVRGVIVTSSFDGQVFSAGLNIFDLYKKSHDHVVKFWTNVQDLHLSYFGCKKPVVACINGHAIGEGCAIALMCDYRVMLGGAKKTIGLNEVKVGNAPTYPFADLMIRTIGLRPAERALLKGKLFSAEEALAVGLIDAVGDLEDIKDIAEKELMEFMSISAFANTKLIMRQAHIDHCRRVRYEEAETLADGMLSSISQQNIGDYLARLGGKR